MTLPWHRAFFVGLSPEVPDLPVPGTAKYAHVKAFSRSRGGEFGAVYNYGVVFFGEPEDALAVSVLIDGGRTFSPLISMVRGAITSTFANLDYREVGEMVLPWSERWSARLMDAADDCGADTWATVEFSDGLIWIVFFALVGEDLPTLPF